MLCLQAQKTLFLTQKTQYVVSSKNLQSISSAVIMCLHSKKHSAQRNVQRTAQRTARTAQRTARTAQRTARIAQYKAHSAVQSAQRVTCLFAMRVPCQVNNAQLKPGRWETAVKRVVCTTDEPTACTAYTNCG